MSPLTRILRSRIMAQGPINIADYMAECLMHPEHGYYTTQTVFGQNGDFITAPEISQMFGEMIGLSLGSAWQVQGCPKKCNFSGTRSWQRYAFTRPKARIRCNTRI
jgi:NADH dehydrogenase [ubiquinone] 1 alpha subcomplex assembly factor 7